MIYTTELWKVIDGIDDKYLVEAMEYKAPKRPYRIVILGVAAVAACIVLFVTGLLNNVRLPIEVYASETEKKLSGVETIIHNGKITDSGAVTGGTVSFFVIGEEIEKIRFSCRNYWIQAADSTEKRETYGNSKNFTLEYGENEAEYKCLLVVWEPTELYFSLKDHDKGVADLTEEERNDLIVLQITFLNGREATVAIDIHIDDEGFISAKVRKYKISADDTFVLQDDISTPHRTSQWWDEHYEGYDGTDRSAEWGVTVENKLYKDFTEEQLSSIMKTLQDYYAGKKRKILSVIRYIGNEKPRGGKYEGYEPEEVIYFRVVIEDDTGAPFYVAIGSKDGWNECQVLSEGY